MKVFSLIRCYGYNGNEFLGVFASKAEAEQSAHGRKDFVCDRDNDEVFMIVESMLGQELNGLESNNYTIVE